MALEDRKQDRPSYDVSPKSAGLLDSREDWLIFLAGVVISVGVLYETYVRQAR
jgi:hypothetical protein